MNILKTNVKAVFKQYPLEAILWGLWQLKGDFDPIQKAYTTTIAIEFSDPGPYDNMIKSLAEPVLMNLVELATSYCLKNSERGEHFSNETHDIFYYIFNLMANQLGVSYSSYGDYARALLLYKIIPEEMGEENSRCFLPREFEEDKGYSIDEYLKVCFIAFAAINGNGKFTDDYFAKVSSIINAPSFETMNAILSDISASAIHYRRERKRINATGSFKYHPLLMYPLIKPWSHISKHQKGKRYLSPLPHLIAYKAHIGIYHHFLSKHKTKFTAFFGKELFERYIGKLLSNSCFGDEFKDEEAISKDHIIPRGVSIPDFLLLRGNQGIIVECKAAVLPLNVYITGTMDDFKTTVNKVYTGVFQTANFEEYAINNSLYSVSEWIRLVVTYEPLWGVNSAVFSDILITDFKEETEAINFRKKFNETLLLSVSQLDAIQPHVSEQISLHSILKKIKGGVFNDVIKDLVNETGKSFQNSYLAKYSDQLLSFGLEREAPDKFK